MTWLARALCLLIALLGAIGVASPAALLAIVRSFQTPSGLYAAAALRVLLGAALWVAAPGSRAPRMIRTVGVVLVVAGAATPLLGLDRFRSILEWWLTLGPWLMRAWAAVTLAFGCVLIYLLVPAWRYPSKEA